MYQQRWSGDVGMVAWADAGEDRLGGDDAADGFRVEIWPERERVRVLPVGELDLMSAPILQDCITELLGVGFEWLRVDLRQLAFMDCAGLRVLVEAESCVEQQRARLEVLNPRGQVLRLLALVAVDQPDPAEPVLQVLASANLQSGSGDHQATERRMRRATQRPRRTPRGLPVRSGHSS